RAVNDLRLKVAGWWRMANVHVRRGDPKSALRCCEEAFGLSPIPFDANMIRVVRGYSHVKLGDIDGGIAEVTEALAWFDGSELSPVRWVYGFWAAEGFLRKGERPRARGLTEEILASSRGISRRVEGFGERLLGEAFIVDDPTAAASHLEAAARILEEIGA